MKVHLPMLAPALLGLCAMVASPVFGQTKSSMPQATPPYVLSVFASAPPGLSAPDDIAVMDGHV